MDVLLSPIFSPTLAVAGILPGLPVLSPHTGYISVIYTDSDRRLLFLGNTAFSVVHLNSQNLTVLHKMGLFDGVDGKPYLTCPIAFWYEGACSNQSLH